MEHTIINRAWHCTNTCTCFTPSGLLSKQLATLWRNHEVAAKLDTLMILIYCRRVVAYVIAAYMLVTYAPPEAWWKESHAMRKRRILILCETYTGLLLLLQCQELAHASPADIERFPLLSAHQCS